MKTIRLKVKPEAYPWLNRAAVEVNQVWNAVNEYGSSVYRNTGRWLGGFDLANYTSGTTKYMDCIGAGTINAVCLEYAKKRKATFKARLRWRTSFGARRSLGWVPFKGRELLRKGDAFRLIGKTLRVFNREYLGDSKICDGNLSQDSAGDWWLCVPIGVVVTNNPAPNEAVGVDLGLKTIATTSDGCALKAGRWTAAYAGKLALAQQRGHRRQAKRIHRKIGRCRADSLHKFSRMLVDNYQHIFIGDVSSMKLVKTNMAKSVLDSGWGMLKQMVVYKGENAGRSVEIVNESYTSRACSNCGSLSGPKGLDMLAVRTWSCEDCEALHDRDINAAKNILVRGKAFPSVSRNEAQP